MAVGRSRLAWIPPLSAKSLARSGSSQLAAFGTTMPTLGKEPQYRSTQKLKPVPKNGVAMRKPKRTWMTAPIDSPSRRGPYSPGGFGGEEESEFFPPCFLLLLLLS